MVVLTYALKQSLLVCPRARNAAVLTLIDCLPPTGRPGRCPSCGTSYTADSAAAHTDRCPTLRVDAGLALLRDADDASDF